jgi:transcriptional regulator with XRE-family HTH domain
MDLGGRIRASRRQLGLTTQQVADRAGLSRASVSQIETNRGNPSVATLQKIALAVGLTLSDLVSDAEDDATPIPAPTRGSARRVPRVVRRDQRKTLTWPGSNWRVSLLTPNVQGLLQVTLDEDNPPDMSFDRVSHDGEELGIVLEGTYEIVVGDETFILEEGDSIYLMSPTPHAGRLVGGKPGRMLWVITPPDF